MNKIPVFTVPLYEFTCEDALTNDVLDIAKEEIYIQNASNKTSTTRLKYKPLIQWFDQCLAEVKQDLYDDLTFDLKVSDCWINKSSYTEKHHGHSHANSMYSGVFYLTTHNKKATTRLFLPNPFYNMDHTNLFAIKELATSSKTSISAEIAPVAGKLLIFPSHVFHETTTNVTRDNRYTVSFNSFISGIIGKDDDLTTLHIITKFLDDE
jgi:uncharacterized protein (TIGR02466 family)